MQKRKPEQWEALLGTTAFDPLDIIDLQDAIRAEQSTVILQGRTFELKYRGDRVFFHPLERYVPCGWLDRERFLHG